jgi:serine/threonine-protein kinase
MSASASDRAPLNAPNRRRFDTGWLLAGRYEIREPIGEGGTAEVYSARDHRLERMVAVKILRPQFGQDPEARARFAVEARAAAGLAVPNIVPIYDFGAADDGSLFIVMRLIDGPSLRSIIAENGRLAEVVVIEIARQIAVALAAAHGSGLIHRDVKPGNILIDRDGAAHLTDFGTVKALGGSDQLTRSGTIFGTAAYLAPEQATGGHIDARTDIYALGVVMYEALSGEPPFSGDDPVAVSYRHAHEPAPALSQRLGGIQPELEALVMACLEKDPARRPPNGHALAESLARMQTTGTHGVATGAAIAAVASSVPDPRTTSFAPRPPMEPDKETAPIERVFAEAPTVAHAPVVAKSSTLPYATDAGVVPAVQMAPRARSRRGASPWTAVAGAALVALAVFVVLGLAAFALFRPGDPTAPPGGVAGSVPPLETAPVVAVESSQSPAPTPTDVPPTISAPPATPEPPAATVEPPVATPIPPVAPVETPIPPVAPVATPIPPVAPAPVAVSVQIPDRLFEGAFPRSSYHGRDAAWVYGQLTDYNTMSATSVALNGVIIYSGPNPLPDDTCCNGRGPGNWGTATFEVPAGLLARENTLAITNLEQNDCTRCPKFVMVDYAELSYTGLP